MGFNRGALHNEGFFKLLRGSGGESISSLLKSCYFSPPPPSHAVRCETYWGAAVGS